MHRCCAVVDDCDEHDYEYLDCRIGSFSVKYIEEDDDHRSSSSDLRQRYSNGYEDARNDSGDDLALEVNGQVEMGSYSDKQEIV